MRTLALLISASAPLLAQQEDLAAVRQSEARRIAVVARCAPAVCSVMDMEAPGGGSGVIFDPAGFVLTNFHVVGAPDDADGKDGKDGKNDKSVLPAAPEPPAEMLEAWQREHADAGADARAEFIAAWQRQWREENLPTGKHHWKNKKVGLPDGLLYEAEVLGVDPGSDLAVLRLLPKVPDQQWPFCRLGDSDQLLVGETVFAMGNPFLLATDFTPTVTFGIVSGTHRYQEGGGNRMLVYPDCIQVDAPVNPGNSGGPLFDEAGEVVGINGRISIGDRGRVNVGVGFAIASNQIKNFLGDLLAGRHAEHGTLDLSAWFMAAPKGDAKRRGVFVQQMFKDSVAAAAGVALGDELTQFNGIAVRSANQLATMVGVLPAHAWVTLGFRPTRDDGSGPERVETMRLSVLDTGSSADKKADSERLASRKNRRLATASLARRWHAVEAADGGEPGVEVTLTDPKGVGWHYRRRGDRLRLDAAGVAFVRTGDDHDFAIDGGKVRDLTPEESAHLLRQLQGNPLLWTPMDRDRALAASLLAGGSHVFGAPAWRFAMPGDGELEFMLFDDGSAAGCIQRDPLRRQRIELHVRAGELRVVADGTNEPGWHIAGPTRATPAEELFRRPQ